LPLLGFRTHLELVVGGDIFFSLTMLDDRYAIEKSKMQTNALPAKRVHGIVKERSG
jgi:hypothetical protein